MLKMARMSEPVSLPMVTSIKIPSAPPRDFTSRMRARIWDNLWTRSENKTTAPPHANSIDAGNRTLYAGRELLWRSWESVIAPLVMYNRYAGYQVSYMKL